MYGLHGISENLKSVYRLAAPFKGSQPTKTIPDLKPAYLSFLNQVQPEYPAREISDLIVRDREHARALIASFSASRINDLHQEKMVADYYEGESQEQSIAAVLQALETLREMNPEVRELIQLVIHSILLCGSNLNEAGLRAYGGTSSKCVGLMWLSMKGGLSTQDIMELLIHEMTHTQVFIDELNFGHFDYEHLTKKENWARSSILNRNRPMDKVIHSIVVSHEVLFARANYLPNTDKISVHPASEVMRANTLQSIASVFAHPNHKRVCKPRALELIAQVEANLLKLEQGAS